MTAYRCSGCFRQLLLCGGMRFRSKYSTSSIIYQYLNEALSEDGNNENIERVTKEIKGALYTGNIKSNDSKNSLTSENLVNHIYSFYQSLNDDKQKKKQFFSFFANHLRPDHEEVIELARKLVDLNYQNRDNLTILRCEGQLQKSLEPMYYQILSLLARKPGGLKMIITMRGDLLDIMHDLKEKKDNTFLFDELNGQLQKLLSQWFSLSFLDLQQITWQSPCDIVEKVSHYEAVHSVGHWKDIKHRVGPYRRVYTFTHCSMPREPIVILHSALTHSPSSSIQALLNRETDSNMETKSISTAVFYSISAAHKGLSGVELGNSLILQVVEALKKEFPTIQQFVTLSPIPGFRKWLEAHLRFCIQNPNSVCKVSKFELNELLTLYPREENHLKIFQNVLNSHCLSRKDETTMALKQPLLSLCARYLIEEKRRGYAINPVANFHIRNGASLWRLNWLANTSPNGLRQSYGIMANYQYDLLTMRDNNEHYILQGKIPYADSVADLLLK